MNTAKEPSPSGDDLRPGRAGKSTHTLSERKPFPFLSISREHFPKLSPFNFSLFDVEIIIPGGDPLGRINLTRSLSVSLGRITHSKIRYKGVNSSLFAMEAVGIQKGGERTSGLKVLSLGSLKDEDLGTQIIGSHIRLSFPITPYKT